MRGFGHLRFSTHWRLRPETNYKLGECDAMVRAIGLAPLRPEVRTEQMRIALIKGAIATTAIEGNTLSESDLAKILNEELTLPESRYYQQQEVENVVDAMNSILEDVVATSPEQQRLTPELLLSFHRKIGKDLGEHFDAIPGRFRQDARHVGGVYKCPDHREVGRLVEQLCEWTEQEFGFRSGQQTFLQAVVQAIVTHVYIEWIHPWGDGNGRTGRLVEFYVLLRSGLPDLATHILSNFYNQTRPEYYRQLQRASQEEDLTHFIRYAIAGLRDGLEELQITIRDEHFRLAWRTEIYERFEKIRYRHKVFKRRRRLMLEFPMSGVVQRSDLPMLTPIVARDYAGLSVDTIQRDLEILMSTELLVREADGYRAHVELLSSHLPVRRS